MKAITPRAEPSHRYKVIKPIEVKPGEIAPREVFDELAESDTFSSTMFDLGYHKEFLPWLKEKDLTFAFDGRQSIPFDILTLSCNRSPKEAQDKLHSVEKFLQDLVSKGGLFLIRENSSVSQDEIWAFDPVKNKLTVKNPTPKPSTLYEKIARSSGIPSSPSNWIIRAPFRRLWYVLHLSIE
jgi:hypothetical protein